jgi:probable HAF family extracellular repeat protein
VLPILGSTASDQDVATAVNDAGDVAGYQFGVLNHPFFWDGSTMHDLGTLPGFSHGSASGLNASDWVVGEVDKGTSGSNHAFVWAPGGAMVDLNTRVKLPAGWVLEFANGINDAGQIVGSALVSGHPHAFRLTPSNVTRIAGATRYDTAAMISSKNYMSPQATVYIANGQNFPDGLAGAALAGREGAPLLLVPATGALPTSVFNELQRLAPTAIVIFGGLASVSTAMANAIQAAVPLAAMSRIAGADRYETASKISLQNYTSPQAKVYIANGQNFPDALAGAALAGHNGAPLLLVPTSGPLPASVLAELQRLAPTTIVIFGGLASVSTAMSDAIQAAVPLATISRLAGATRYDTAAAIAAAGFTNPQPTVYIASGLGFADALAGAALAGHKGAPLLLVPTTGTLPASVSTELGDLAPTQIVIFGGTVSVSTSMELAIAQY